MATSGAVLCCASAPAWLTATGSTVRPRRVLRAVDGGAHRSVSDRGFHGTPLTVLHLTTQSSFTVTVSTPFSTILNQTSHLSHIIDAFPYNESMCDNDPIYRPIWNVC